MSKTIQIGGYTLTLKEELTARDSREINREMLDGMKFDKDGNPVGGEGFGVEISERREDVLIKTCVLKFGEEENADAILEKCLDLPKAEYDKLLEQIAPLMGLPQTSEGS